MAACTSATMASLASIVGSHFTTLAACICVQVAVSTSLPTAMDKVASRLDEPSRAFATLKES